jgi:small conductance mechanosensitive channel
VSGVILERGDVASTHFLPENIVRFVPVDKIRELIPKDSIAEQLLLVVLLIVIIWFFNKSFRLCLKRAEKHGFDRAATPLVSDLVKYTTYAIGLLLGLNILGVNTNGLLAMLGAASLAVGLALKDTLSNVASGLLLLFLRPFVAGDYIECGSIKGKICAIGLFNTTLETFEGIYVSAPNRSLWGSPIVNYARNPIRRLDINVGVSYDASLDVVFCALRRMVEQEASFMKVPPPKFFVSEYADSSINVTVWVWVRTFEYYELKRKYSRIIKDVLDEHKIEIPFPQRVVHLVKEGEEAAVAKEREPDFDDLVQDEVTFNGVKINLNR